jgi:hypothetical protein
MTRRDADFQQRQREVMRLGGAFVIDLTVDGLRASTSADTAKIGTAMLFPDDPNARLMDSNLAAAGFVLELDKQRRQRFERGLVAGRILIAAVGNAGQTNPTGALVTMKDAKESARQPFDYARQTQGRNQTKVSLKLIDNEIWPQFQPVAHFWAAYHDHLGKTCEFPCAPCDLFALLAHAEAYRRLGEATRLRPNSSRPVLDASRTVRLPDDVGSLLPKGILNFSTDGRDDGR